MVSYVTKKNKKVILLSNFHHNKSISDTIKSKPQIITDYNHNKSGVDILDMLLNGIRPYRATRRWPCVIFYDLIAMAAHASYVLYSIKFPKCPLIVGKKRRIFIYELAKELIAPHVQNRQASNSYKYLHRDAKESMEYIISSVNVRTCLLTLI